MIVSNPVWHYCFKWVVEPIYGSCHCKHTWAGHFSYPVVFYFLSFTTFWITFHIPVYPVFMLLMGVISASIIYILTHTWAIEVRSHPSLLHSRWPPPPLDSTALIKQWPAWLHPVPLLRSRSWRSNPMALVFCLLHMVHICLDLPTHVLLPLALTLSHILAIWDHTPPDILPGEGCGDSLSSTLPLLWRTSVGGGPMNTGVSSYSVPA